MIRITVLPFSASRSVKLAAFSALNGSSVPVDYDGNTFIAFNPSLNPDASGNSAFAARFLKSRILGYFRARYGLARTALQAPH